VFFSEHELINLFYFSGILILLFWRFDKFLFQHSFHKDWRIVGRAIFYLAFFIFLTNAFFQYFAYAFYILDSNIKYYNIVLFRAWAMTMFWLCGFSLASLLYQKFSGRIKHFFVIFWAFVFIAGIFLGLVNVGITYNSGLYLNPIILDYAGGGGLTVFYKTTIVLTLLFLVLTGLFIYIFKKYIKANRSVDKKQWLYYNFAIIGLAIFSFLSVASFKNTPEAMVIKSFITAWTNNNKQVELNPIVKQKLERFGLKYDLDEFYLNQRNQVFITPLTTEFSQNKPNVVIFFLESFSARLTSVYNPNLVNLTPALEDFANNEKTIVFHNYFNASTPTITGLISQMCSILPPTGHNEIEKEKKLQNHHLLCLPKVLKESGYKEGIYMTAVDKDFANKDSIMASMGVDTVVGQEELAKIIPGEPLSWGYSDHQTMPILWDKMNELKDKNKEPFLLAISSVDSHPPFDRTKDVVKYSDGKNKVLNTIHTTDDAFGQWWNKFKQSDFYNNTVVVVVSDHAIFPTAYAKDLFPEEAGKMNYYDEETFMIYTPKEVLPPTSETYASGIDFTPTLLHILNINIPNSFEGYSIFGERKDYPNLLGMHEYGLYINEEVGDVHATNYVVPNDLNCDGIAMTGVDEPLTLCEYFNYFQWKRQMFEEGRLWMKP
jgi:phosphoglycerol transferase MdoB-like AlkP superfamily enzyme